MTRVPSDGDTEAQNVALGVSVRRWGQGRGGPVASSGHVSLENSCTSCLSFPLQGESLGSSAVLGGPGPGMCRQLSGSRLLGAHAQLCVVPSGQ